MEAGMPWVLIALLTVQTPETLREAITLGRTTDQALYDSFNSVYSLPVAAPVERAEVITEFRRAVLLVRERVAQGDYVMSPPDLAGALAPFRGLVTFIVEVKLNPLNTFARPPGYDLYIATGPATRPLASPSVKIEPIFPVGTVGPGNPITAIRLEASFARADIVNAARPTLMLVDQNGNQIWQSRIDVTRYR
jgi:hypothetical protein